VQFGHPSTVKLLLDRGAGLALRAIVQRIAQASLEL